MKIYLVQHAEAKSKEEDPQRSLSEEGRRNARAVASMAEKLALQVMRIDNSGKTRAVETADIFADHIKPAQGVAAISGLGPLDAVEPIAKKLEEGDEDVMVVGHLPFMERLTGYLVAGDAGLPVVNYQNGGIVCLMKVEDRWRVSWVLTPQLALTAQE